VAGGFTWTGWDYKGEPTPFGWPDVNSHFGTLDIAGFEKDLFYWYKAHFPTYAPGTGMVHLLPHWNWAPASASALAPAHLTPCAGRCSVAAGGALSVDVWAYSNGATVELFVNGESAGAVSPVAGNLSHFEWWATP
jgi:beta-galactosidase